MDRWKYWWSCQLYRPLSNHLGVYSNIKCFIMYVEFRTPNLRLKREPLTQQATVLLTFNYLLKTDSSYGRFFSRKLTGYNIQLAPRLLQPWYHLSKCLTSLSNKKGKSSRVWFVLDTFVPFVPDTEYMSSEQANGFLKRYWVYWFMESTLSIYNHENEHLWKEACRILGVELTRPTTVQEISVAYETTEENVKALLGLFLVFIEERRYSIRR